MCAILGRMIAVMIMYFQLPYYITLNDYIYIHWHKTSAITIIRIISYSYGQVLWAAVHLDELFRLRLWLVFLFGPLEYQGILRDKRIKVSTLHCVLLMLSFIDANAGTNNVHRLESLGLLARSQERYCWVTTDNCIQMVLLLSFLQG